MTGLRWKLWGGVVWMGLLLLAACSGRQVAFTPAATTATVTPSPTWAPRPYASPTATPSPQPWPSPTLAAVAAPSPTPWTYTVAKGDTMLGIALKFGVTLKALEQANPGVDPQFLSVGARLIIPLNGDNPAGLPTPTPLPATVGQPFCAPQGDGSVVCLATVSNPGSEVLASVAVLLTLADADGQQAEALRDVLPPGEQTVVVARFLKAPLPPYRAAVRVLRALPLTETNYRQRYPAVQVQGAKTALDGRMARVSGEVIFPEKMPLRALWVVAVAYDGEGRPVGVRRWEAPLPVDFAKPLPFDFAVFSVGPKIDRVVVQAEAHALLPATPTP